MGDDTNKSSQSLLSPVWDKICQRWLEIAEKYSDDDGPGVAIMRFMDAIDNFLAKFKQGTKNVEGFISISEIEDLLSTLDVEQRALTLELLTHEINNISEELLVKKKRRST